MDQIAGDVARAPRHEAFALKFHYGHWGFRRDSPDFAPDELVQHDIAQHQDARAVRRGQQLARLRRFQPGRIHDSYFMFYVHKRAG
jgi:hypothetical protein